LAERLNAANLNLGAGTGQLKLAQLNVDQSRITVSGFSSGGTMAQQVFVSHSEIVQGCGTISHAFYRCGPGDGVVDNYDRACTTEFDPPVSTIYNPKLAIADLQFYAAHGIIDPVVYLKNKPLYIFAGSSSFLFNMDLGLGAATVFEDLIGNNSAIKVRVQEANLTLPTDNPSMPSCRGEVNNLWISNCAFSAAFEMLQWLLGSDTVSVHPTTNGSVTLQPLWEFEQSEFLTNTDNVAEGGAGMDLIGFYYIPKSCQESHGFTPPCPLHVYFHGCRVGREFTGSEHIMKSGYLEVAELNNVIMLFPQSHSTPANEFACWDTYGYASRRDYATKEGVQVNMVHNMISRVSGL